MPSLFSEFTLKRHILRNRIVFPPIVCFGYSNEQGFVSGKNVKHFELRAEGGAGLIITEATCIRPDGKASPNQLGIWSDDHIEGLSRIPAVVRKHGAISLIQIHHAGLVSPVPVNDCLIGPSGDPDKPNSRGLSVSEVRELRDAYINAGIRAMKAGFDGVELHGAHGYMLNQFANPNINRREDEYGGDLTGRLRLAAEIIEGIRDACKEDFIIGYRMGANSPALDDGILIAKHLESLGIDYLSVSHGGNLQNLPRPPKGFDFNWIVFSGVSVKEQVQLPVIVVNEIKTADRANYLLENKLADLVAIGRPMLADPFWANNVEHDQPVNICSSCKPKCRWYEQSSLCPAFHRLQTIISDLS